MFDLPFLNALVDRKTFLKLVVQFLYRLADAAHGGGGHGVEDDGPIDVYGMPAMVYGMPPEATDVYGEPEVIYGMPQEPLPEPIPEPEPVPEPVYAMPDEPEPLEVLDVYGMPPEYPMSNQPGGVRRGAYPGSFSW